MNSLVNSSSTTQQLLSVIESNSMKKIYYEKRGRSYVPVSEYDSEYLDSFSKGTHLVMVYPGGQSRWYNIDPAYTSIFAAGRVAEDAICTAMVKAEEVRPQRKALTSEECSLDESYRSLGRRGS